MATAPVTNRAEDSIPKVDGSVAVGEDLEFQRKWWRFENGVWVVFILLLLCDLTGLFGRGFLAKAKAAAADQSLSLDYERVQRAGTPSIMTIRFGPSAIQGGQVRLFISESVIKELGAQRVSPQPLTSTLTQDGVVYTFPAEGPGVVEIALSPSFPGKHQFATGIVGGLPVQATAYVLP